MKSRGAAAPLVSNPLPEVKNVAPLAAKRVSGLASMVGGAAAPPPSQLIPDDRLVVTPR